ncbi:MAG: hypothetical protein KDC38_14370 [Planctomycetes bacterium]|nr:hypothetical protein [Planctomycetota bacterium]
MGRLLRRRCHLRRRRCGLRGGGCGALGFALLSSVVAALRVLLVERDLERRLDDLLQVPGRVVDAEDFAESFELLLEITAGGEANVEAL